MRTGAWAVRRADRGDLEAILEVEQGCEGAPHWSEAIWAAVLTGGLHRACLVAERDGTVVGFVVVGVARDVAELESVAVVEEMRRLGVGRALCDAAMVWARQIGAMVMELEVRASSGSAIALYEGLGFREQGRRRGYYRDPVTDAVLMQVLL